MLYNRYTGIYKFGNNTYPWRMRRTSNLGHIFGGKRCILWVGKYGKCEGKLCFNWKWGESVFYSLDPFRGAAFVYIEFPDAGTLGVP